MFFYGQQVWAYLDLRLGGCSCTLQVDYHSKTATVIGLRTREEFRNKKHATRLLRAIKKWAIKRGMTVKLWAGPFYDRPMNTKQLLEFYKKMGFKQVSKIDLEFSAAKV